MKPAVKLPFQGNSLSTHLCQYYQKPFPLSHSLPLSAVSPLRLNHSLLYLTLFFLQADGNLSTPASLNLCDLCD